MTTRRLAAILAADVVGFSSMMEKDEEGTLQRVKALQRDVIEKKVKERGGRLVKTTGDGFLCEFGSPVEAVRCAVEVQDATKANRDSDLLLRVGINLGDIIVEPDGDIYGDGVNVAARLEQLAEPGGICISGSVHEHAEEGRGSVREPRRTAGQEHNPARKGLFSQRSPCHASAAKGATPP
jgi:adenylate cyclase